MEQVMTNLIANAIKYGASKPIEVVIQRGARKALVTVRDQGIGIEADKLPRLFGRFERAASARSYGGLGLGLYITRQIVEAHGGTIRVASEEGVGSVFTIELPCAGASTEASSAAEGKEQRGPQFPSISTSDGGRSPTNIRDSES
jgi:signal transduction histidine kinase